MSYTTQATERLYGAIVKELSEIYLSDILTIYTDTEVCLGHLRNMQESYTLTVSRQAGRGITAHFSYTNNHSGEPIHGDYCKSYSAYGIEAADERNLKMISQHLLVESNLWNMQDWHWWCTSLKIELSRQMGIQLEAGVIKRTDWAGVYMYFEGETHELVVEDDDTNKRYKVLLVDKRTGKDIRYTLGNREPTAGIVHFLKDKLQQ